jgi:hypothetical protein
VKEPEKTHGAPPEKSYRPAKRYLQESSASRAVLEDSIPMQAGLYQMKHIQKENVMVFKGQCSGKRNPGDKG